MGEPSALSMTLCVFVVIGIVAFVLAGVSFLVWRGCGAVAERCARPAADRQRSRSSGLVAVVAAILIVVFFVFLVSRFFGAMRHVPPAPHTP